MYEIKELSQVEISDLMVQYPYTPIKAFQLLDDGLSAGFADTREEAEAEVRNMENADRVMEIIREKVRVINEELQYISDINGVDITEVKRMFKGEL